MNFADQLFQFLHDHKGLPFRTMTVFNFLLEATLCGALLILLMLLVRRFLRGKIGSRAVYFAWLLVAVRLLVPLSLPNAAMNELRPTLSMDEGARPIADQVRVRFQDAASELSRTVRQAEHPNQTFEEMNREPAHYTLSSLLSDIAAYTSYGWLGKWYFFAYFAVDGGVLIYMTVVNLRFRRKMRKNRVNELCGDALVAYHELCVARKIRPIPVYWVDPLESACLVGVVRPYIALPLSTKPEMMEKVLLHELCHHKDRDEWWGVLRNLCCVVHWFNPLVWVAARCSRTDCELACDERVTSRMNDEQRIDYANTLVNAASRRERPALSVLATGMTMTGKRLKQRISSIVRDQRVQRWVLIVFVVPAMVALMFSFATGEDHSQDYDVQLEKAIHWLIPDEPFGLYEDYQDVPTVEPTVLTDADTAIEQACHYLDTLYLRNTPSAEQQFTASHTDDGWTVLMNEYGRGTAIRMDDNGVLLHYDCRLYNVAETRVNTSVRLPIGVEDAMVEYLGYFAQKCLGGRTVASVSIDDDTYDLTSRYLTVTANDDQGELVGRFLIEIVDSLTIRQFDNGQEAGITAETVLKAFTIELTETSIANFNANEQLAAVRLSVEPYEQLWLATAQVSARTVNRASLEYLQEQYGVSPTYTLERLYDPNGQCLTEYDNLHAYQTREQPTITEEEATAIGIRTAAAYFGVDPSEVTSNVTDSYPERANYDVFFDIGEGSKAGQPWGHILVDSHSGEPYLLKNYQQQGAAMYISLPIGAASTETAEASSTLAAVDNAAADLPATITPTGGAFAFAAELRTDEGYLAAGTTNDLPIEDALKIAVDRICEQYAETDENLAKMTLVYGFRSEDNVAFDEPYWQFDLYDGTVEGGYEIMVHSPDGAVIYVVGPGEGNG